MFDENGFPGRWVTINLSHHLDPFADNTNGVGCQRCRYEMTCWLTYKSVIPNDSKCDNHQRSYHDLDECQECAMVDMGAGT